MFVYRVEKRGVYMLYVFVYREKNVYMFVYRVENVYIVCI